MKDSTVVGQNFYSYGKLKYLSGKQQVCEMGVYLNPGNDKFYKAINSEDLCGQNRTDTIYQSCF